MLQKKLKKSPDDILGKSRLPKDGWGRQEYHQGYLSLSKEDLKDMSSYRACSIGPRVYLTPADFPTVEEFEDAAYSAAYKLYYNNITIIGQARTVYGITKVLWM